jgi:hypothetical protein
MQNTVPMLVRLGGLQHCAKVGSLIAVCSFAFLSGPNQAQGQAQPTKQASGSPLPSAGGAAVVPPAPSSPANAGSAQVIPIKVLPRVIQPSNGKLPTSVSLAIFEDKCDDTHGTDLSSTDKTSGTGYTLMVTGTGLSFSGSPKRSKCVIAQALSIDPTTPPGTYSVLLLDPSGSPVGSSDLGVLDSSAGPIPPGLPPQVDVMWTVMSQNNCADVFGTRIAISLYCIQLKIGNNSGHPLQLAGIGFTSRLNELVKVAGASVTVSNSSYVSTRAVLLHQEMWNPRNVLYHVVEGTGLIMAGFLPYYSGALTANSKAHFATAASIVSGPLLAAFNLVAPDPILSQLNDLDDQSFRDSVIIPNNTQVQTVVFVEKQALTQPLRDLKVRIEGDAEAAREAANSDTTQTKADKDQAEKDKGDAAKTKADEAKTQEDDAKAQADNDKADILDKMAADAEMSIHNSRSPLLLRLFDKGRHDPLLVKLALGDVVIVGEQIEYLQRVQIQSNSTAAVANVTVSPATAQLAAGTTQQFTATVTNDQNGAGVTWSLSGQTCKDAACGVLGSVTTTTVTYTAPATPPAANPAVTITASSKADSTKSGTATITVTNKIAVTIQQKSPAPSVTAGGSPITITATTTDPGGAGVIWKLSDSACATGTVCGSLTNATATSVSYVPPQTKPNPNTITVTATSVTDSSQSDSVKVTVN